MDQNSVPPQGELNNVVTNSKNPLLPAFLAYILFFLPLFFNDSIKNHPYVRFHMKQGFLLFVLNVLTLVVGYFPVIELFSWILSIVVFILFIIGILNALGNKEKELPIIGKFAKEVNFL